MSLLQMSLSGALVIAAIILLRMLGLYKFRPKMFFALWFIALLRLLMPIAVPSPTSVVNLLQIPVAGVFDLLPVPVVENKPQIYIDQEMTVTPGHALEYDNMGMPMGTFQVGDILSYERYMPVAPFEPLIEPLTLAWLIGVVIFGIVFTVAYSKHRRHFADSIPVNVAVIDDWLKAHKLRRKISIRMSNRTITPLTYGIYRPVILLPASTDWTNISELEYVLTHEFVHIKRFDALTKIIATVALGIHWFNPFAWVMYFLLNRDMETSCDETVVNMYGLRSKRGYALTLVGMVERGGYLPALHSNFSKHAIEERIKLIMKMRRNTFLGAIATVALIGIMVAVFATNGVADVTGVTVYATEQDTDVATTTAATNIPASNANTPATNAIPTPQLPASNPNLDRAVERAIEQTEALRDAINQDNFDRPMLSFGDPTAEPGTNSISLEEAARIGLNALAELFGADLSVLANHDIQIFYSESWDPLYFPEVDSSYDDVEWGRPQPPETAEDYSFEAFEQRIFRSAEDFPDYWFPMSVRRSVWSGSITSVVERTPEDDDGRMFRGRESFRFTVAADTGKLISAQFFPSEDPIERVGAGYVENMGNALAVFEYSDSMTNLHNLEYSELAIRTVTELGILEGEVLRARMIGGGWAAGRNRSFELTVFVEVECTNGEVFGVSFQGRNRQELVSIHFADRFISHNVNRDGSITTEPAARHTHPDSYEFEHFDWVYK